MVDRIFIVSQGYVWEIIILEGGCGFDKFFVSCVVVINGIINGVDVDDWSFFIDCYLIFIYIVGDLVGKVECKVVL